MQYVYIWSTWSGDRSLPSEADAFPLRRALDRAEPRPPADSSRKDKKNYAERLSRHIAQELADRLRGAFKGILPRPDGSGQESRARTSKGFKKLDINYSTPELGLGLGVSIKTVNFVDAKSRRYTKNYSRIDNELRAEASDYHTRQPYAVLVGVVLLPYDSCLDGKGPSSFGSAIQFFRSRNQRKSPRNELDTFEAMFVGLYVHEGENRGQVMFHDVETRPPRVGPPLSASCLDMRRLASRIIEVYDQRNKPKREWAEDPQ
jgi:hypothetical protein